MMAEETMETTAGGRPHAHISHPEPMLLPASSSTLLQEIWCSSEFLFQNKITWLLALGPVALLGDATDSFGEATCFALSGIALIPCAERLSYVTEQVAAHTNGTIGALLNATFGNAPELLIATAALRAGYYRVVQLTMLGSMLTNLLFVFGLSCLIGGLRWQVQELRITSGNVSVGMLLLSTTASLLPASLVLTGQLRVAEEVEVGVPSKEELQFCRVNAFVMIFMYICYLIFQLGTHKEEFDEEENVVESAAGHQLHLAPHFTSRHGRQFKARRNKFCLKIMSGCMKGFGIDIGSRTLPSPSSLEEIGGDLEMPRRGLSKEHMSDKKLHLSSANGYADDYPPNATADSSDISVEEGAGLLSHDNLSINSNNDNGYFNDSYSSTPNGGEMFAGSEDSTSLPGVGSRSSRRRAITKARSERRKQLKGKQSHTGSHGPTAASLPSAVSTGGDSNHGGVQMSFRAGIVWLFVITLCISAMSDILVDTIDGFAMRLHISEVFTSMVIVPFFSNVAEQVSAVLFAYRNEMDLCVGVTVGSAIQVASFVLPGCVLIGMAVDRSMTLYFHAYETMCMFLAVVVVAAVLQGGTTNWLVGATMIGIYIIIATGIWFHELEDLTVDAELAISNSTAT